MKLPIPQDWNGTDYCYHFICWPDSHQYAAILLGQITALHRGYFWDEKTGNIKDQQELIEQLLADNTDEEGVIMGCNDLVDVLTQISNGIANIEQAQVDISISNSAQASSSAAINQNVIAMSLALSRSQAWANSIAIATASVELTNNVSLTVGPVSPTQPPIAAQEPETGISTTVSTVDYCDAAIYLVDYAIKWFELLHKAVQHFGETSITAIFAVVGDAFAALELFGIPAPPTPSAALSQLSAQIYEWALEKVLYASSLEAVEALGDLREDLICLIRNEAANGADTAVIRALVGAELQYYGLSDNIISAIMSVLHPATMAMLYYVSPIATIPPTTKNCDFCDV